MSALSAKIRLALTALLFVPCVASADPPEPKAKLEHDGPVNVVVFSPDGKLLAAGDHDSTIRLWDATTGKLVHKMQTTKGKLLSVSFAPDGKTLASAGTDAWIRLWDVEKGTQIREFREAESGFWRVVTYSGDGRTLISGDANCRITFWDTSTAKAIHRFPASPDGPLTMTSMLGGLVLLCNGRFVLALTTPFEVRSRGIDTPPPQLRLISAATGKELARTFSVDAGEYLALSPDGKSAAVAHLPTNKRNRLSLVEVATGQKRAIYKEPAAALAFSPGGRFLATADPKEHFILVRDLITGQIVLRFAEHEAEVTSLAFSPDGKLLASASGDFSVLLWDTSSLAKRKLSEIKLSDAELQAGWEQFAGTDAAKGYQVRNQFLSASPQSVPFLRTKLDALSVFDGKRVAQLIRDLDSKQFNVRHQATAELEELGAQAEAALQQVLDNKPTLEVKRRVQDLLQRIGSPLLGPEQLRVLRSVEVLEVSGTPEARQALEHFAKPEPPSFLTLEARAALRRLDRLAGKP